MTVDRDVRVPSAVGVELATDIFHPEGSGPFPTLLLRTPYGKDFIGPALELERFRAAGYRVVLQDCRGTGKSSGAPDRFVEAVDGRACGDWIASQTVVRRQARDAGQQLYGNDPMGAGLDQAALSQGDGDRPVQLQGNTRSGEPQTTALRTSVVSHKIWHDSVNASRITLPVAGGSLATRGA